MKVTQNGTDEEQAIIQEPGLGCRELDNLDTFLPKEPNNTLKFDSNRLGLYALYQRYMRCYF